MSQQPDTPPLTRRKLRELRQTGAIPIIVPEPSEKPAAPPVELAPDSEVDLGVAPTSRAEARQHDRIRKGTGFGWRRGGAPVVDDARAEVDDARAEADDAHEEVDDAHEGDLEEAVHVDDGADDDADVTADEIEVVELAVVDHDHDDDEDAAAVEIEEEPASPVVNTSFDELLSRSTSVSGSAASPNALIVSTDTGAAAIVAPVAATGEVLVTGSLDLPAGLGSLGHAPGAADGKEVDELLIDGELPAHSSPVPISASAAVSAIKNQGEIIAPPAPEKSNKLMLVLAITAGVLAAALLTVLVVAMTTGLF